MANKVCDELNNNMANYRKTVSRRIKDVNLCDIPKEPLYELCTLLDKTSNWETLAIKYMEFDEETVEDIKRNMKIGESPTEELIFRWSNYNHTVPELFYLLSKMNEWDAMEIIKNLVDKKYHCLLRRPAFSDLLAPQMNNMSLRTEMSEENNEANTLISQTTIQDIAGSILQISYHELKMGTNNWSESNILGRGGFGVVYKGQYKRSDMAIKRITYRDTASEKERIERQQSINELKYLNACRHDNILSLYGYSIDGDHPCLVYQLMKGGSLANRLHGPKKYTEPLPWIKRYTIALGTARGLQYLHTFKSNKTLIHGDIKPANILLDECGIPRIGDFGLAREGPNSLSSSMQVSRVYGTEPYLPAEFLKDHILSTKVDTFGFGVVLLEMVTGLPAYNNNRPKDTRFLTQYMTAQKNLPIEKLTDRVLSNDLTPDDIEIAQMLLQLGYHCIEKLPAARPEMVQVLTRLEELEDR